MTDTAPDPALAERWLPRLRELAARIRGATGAALLAAQADGDAAALTRPLQTGAGDVTYGLDLPTEEVLSAWLDEVAREEPLSLLTEDAGWRHRGPGGSGTVELEGFAHPGPRIVVDPVDGTRNLMFDMRSAWTVIGFATRSAGPPRFSDLDLGLVGELPTTRAGRYRLLEGRRGGGCRLALRSLPDDALVEERALQVDADDRPDHGVFSFFRHHPRLRPAVAAVEAAFFRRIAAGEGADVRRCYDDQYLASAGQLVLLSLGTYRMAADLRARLGAHAHAAGAACKPYDLAGALVCALAAGCAVTTPAGAPLDFPLDTHTPVGWVGYANPATAARLQPHLRAALEEVG